MTFKIILMMSKNQELSKFQRIRSQKASGIKFQDSRTIKIKIQESREDSIKISTNKSFSKH